MFKIGGTKSQGCCYCDKFKLVNGLFEEHLKNKYKADNLNSKKEFNLRYSLDKALYEYNTKKFKGTKFWPNTKEKEQKNFFLFQKGGDYDVKLE